MEEAELAGAGYSAPSTQRVVRTLEPDRTTPRVTTTTNQYLREHRPDQQGDTVAIAQFPDHSRLNPLLGIYRAVLNEAGIGVCSHGMYPGAAGAEPRLSAQWLWRHRKRIQILHFHYFQRLYLADSLGRTPAKFLAFVAKVVLARALGYRLTWTAHNLYPHERYFPRIDLLARWLVTILASVVFVDSPGAQATVRRAFPWIRRFVEVPHGHLVGVYPPGKPMEEARRQHGIPQEAFVFLTFGLIRPYKGVEALVDTFVQELAGPECHLVVAGDPWNDEVRHELQRLAAGSRYVHLQLGFVPHEQVSTLFNMCNVAVFPFADIFTSSTTILACSLARPVVVPRMHALPVDDVRGVISYDPSQTDGLLNALRAGMLVDWEQEGRRAMEDIMRRDWKLIGERMAAAFRNVARHG